MVDGQAMFPEDMLQFFRQTSNVGHSYWVGPVSWGHLRVWSSWLKFFYLGIWSIQGSKLFCLRTLWMCSTSVHLSWSSLTISPALLRRLLCTDLLCSIEWWEWPLSYWSVCVGLRYTVVFVLPSSLRCILTSKNARHPSTSGSLVKEMFLSMLLMWSVNSCIWCSWIRTKVSFT